jgi:type VI secretion system protein ImpM
MITGQFQQSGWELHQQQIALPQRQTQNKSLKNERSIVEGVKSNTQKVQKINCNSISSTPEQRASKNSWKSFSRTDIGKVRQYNEDAILDRPDMGLWVVADGMGGHHAGDVASKKIIHTLNELDLSSSQGLTVTQVQTALQGVNHELKELAGKTYDHQIIGSTVVVLMAGKTHFTCLWAGDSRLYRLRDHKLLQLTIDHCREQEDITDVLSIGSITGLKQNNVITKAIGARDELELDCQIIDIQAGDLFLLSSDGLDKEVSFQEIEKVLVENDYSDSVEILLEQVLSRGSRDNVSVIVVEVNNDFR